METICQDAFLASLPGIPMREPMLAAYSEGRLVERRRDAVIVLAGSGSPLREDRRNAVAPVRTRVGDETLPAGHAPAQIRAEDLSVSLSRTEAFASTAGHLRVLGSSIAGSVRTIPEAQAAETGDI